MNALLPYLEHKSHVIWDWNGTLLSDLEHNVHVMNTLLAECALPAISTEHHREHFGFPVIEYYKKLGFDTTRDHFAMLCTRFNDLYESGLDRCDLAAGTREILTELSKAGKTQSLLSATKQATLERVVARYHLSDLFQNIYGIRDDQAGSKVDRGRELLEYSGFDKSQTILIGDTDHDLEVATTLRIDAVLVDHGHQSRKRLLLLHEKVVSCY